MFVGFFSLYGNKMFAFIYCNLESNASANPSPIKLKRVTVIKIAKPGNIANHHDVVLSLAKLNNSPQVISSFSRPIPKKDRKASIKIADATPNAIVINTGAIEFGIACLIIIRQSLNPIAFAASINSRDLTLNNSARTNRAILVHFRNPIIIMIETIDGFSKIVTAANKKNKDGIAFTISINRIIIRSNGIIISFEKKGM